MNLKIKKTLSPEGKKKKADIKVDYAQLPAGPSRLRENYSEQPWRRTGPLKTVAWHIHAYVTYSVLGLVKQLPNLTAAPSPLIKGDQFL